MRQALAILLGLWLGWGAAAWATEPAHDTHAGHDHATHADGEHAHDLGQSAASHLVPAGQQITWVGPLVTGVICLFAAAVIIGIPSLKLRGPLPPDPADSHDDHDAHGAGHDDHGHGHGHAAPAPGHGHGHKH